MSRTITRSSKMDATIKIRGTQKDIADIRVAAQRQGLDVSAFLRQMLIQEKVISPLG